MRFTEQSQLSRKTIQSITSMISHYGLCWVHPRSLPEKNCGLLSLQMINNLFLMMETNYLKYAI